MTEGDGLPAVGADDRPEEEGPIGIFSSWRWVYATVLAWTVLLVVLLWVFTVTLDYGAP